MIREALLWERRPDGRILCKVCAQYCKIAPGQRGVCNTREHRDGKLWTLTYGTVASVAVDPVEKKPFHHFYPGSRVFSLSSLSCSYRCSHCHNASISFARVKFDGEEAVGVVPEAVAREEGGPVVHPREIPPEEAVALCERHGAAGLAWTYNEPTITVEYTHDCARLAKELGLYTCYVTNGTFTPESQAYMSPVLDAANVDVKAFTEPFYRKICGGRLEPVLETCERIRREGKIHLEITYLVIPGQNDDTREFRDFCSWVVRSLGADTPLHISRFQPYGWTPMDYPTPVATLERAHGIAKRAGVEFVYVGNVPGHDTESTHCPDCGELLIRRVGYRTKKLFQGRNCPACGRSIPLIDADAPAGGKAKTPAQVIAG